MQYTAIIMTTLTLAGCASFTQVRDGRIEASQTPDALVSGAAGNEITGQRILMGSGIGAAIGALAGAALVELGSDEYNFVSDNSGTEPWKGALVGGVVGAAAGAVLAVITAKKVTRRRPPPIPDRVTKAVQPSVHEAGSHEASSRCPRSLSRLSFCHLQADYTETTQMKAVQ